MFYSNHPSNLKQSIRLPAKLGLLAGADPDSNEGGWGGGEVAIAGHFENVDCELRHLNRISSIFNFS